MRRWCSPGNQSGRDFATNRLVYNISAYPSSAPVAICHHDIDRWTHAPGLGDRSTKREHCVLAERSGGSPVTAALDARTVASSLIAGAATGLRSTSGLAAIITAGSKGRLPQKLQQRRYRSVTLLLTAGELIADKLPGTPARTAPRGLIPRVVLGGVSADRLAPAHRRFPAAAVLLGSAAAVGSAFGGRAARSRLSARIGPIPAALVEDAITGLLAATAPWIARRNTTGTPTPVPASSPAGPSSVG